MSRIWWNFLKFPRTNGLGSRNSRTQHLRFEKNGSSGRTHFTRSGDKEVMMQKPTALLCNAIHNKISPKKGPRKKSLKDFPEVLERTPSRSNLSIGFRRKIILFFLKNIIQFDECRRSVAQITNFVEILNENGRC